MGTPSLLRTSTTWMISNSSWRRLLRSMITSTSSTSTANWVAQYRNPWPSTMTPVSRWKEKAPAEIKDETHKKNVDRCRDYRVAKKAKDGDQVAELKQLEKLNNELMVKEEEMRERLERVKKIYIDLIATGRIKFV